MTLMNQYNRLMEHIQVTPEMLSRAHAALDNTALSTRHHYKKVFGTVAACLLLMIGIVPFLQNTLLSPPEHVASTGIEEYSSIAQLAEAVSFPLAVPTALPDGYTFASAANQFGTAVICYTNGTQEIKYCMGVGNSAPEGIYPTTSGRPLDVPNATLYQDDFGNFVTWYDTQYSYCIISDTNFTDAQWEAMILSVQ